MLAVREASLLQHIYAAGASGSDVLIPPGDDMGALRIGEQTVLVTVDQLADGIHVRLEDTPLEKVGYKAIARSVSDVAAMAAKPSGAVVAAALPYDFGETRANALFDAARAAAQHLNCPLIGGDIAMWDRPMNLTVTVLAEPAGIGPVLRSGAQAGDAVYVTGALGGSMETVDGYTHHLDFEPRVAVARSLAGEAGTRPHCMIDLSDGLGRDLSRLCGASNVSAVIDADALPMREAAKRGERAAWQRAVSDGEDYELLFTAPDGAIPSEIEGVKITRIGRIERATGDPRAMLRLSDGSEVDLSESGWEHRGDQ